MQSDVVLNLFYGFSLQLMVLERLSAVLDNHVQSYQL